MSMTISPMDGLVTRLLQQQTRHSSAPVQDGEPKGKSTDQVSISPQARQQGDGAEKNQGPINAFGYKQEQLESQLINLYTQHAKTEPKA